MNRNEHDLPTQEVVELQIDNHGDNFLAGSIDKVRNSAEIQAERRAKISELTDIFEERLTNSGLTENERFVHTNGGQDYTDLKPKRVTDIFSVDEATGAQITEMINLQGSNIGYEMSYFDLTDGSKIGPTSAIHILRNPAFPDKLEVFGGDKVELSHEELVGAVSLLTAV